MESKQSCKLKGGTRRKRDCGIKKTLEEKKALHKDKEWDSNTGDPASNWVRRSVQLCF